MRGITKADLTTVDGQKIIKGAKSLVGAQKSGEQKKRKNKVAMKNAGYQSLSEGATKACRGRQKAASRGATEPKVAQRYATVSNT